MAPRSGPRVKVISPTSGTASVSRSVSLASSTGSALCQHGGGHASAATTLPLHSGAGRSALRPVGVNTSHGSTHTAGGKSTLYAHNSRNTAAPADATAATSSRRAALPNYFEQAADARPVRPRDVERRLPTPSASRSHSRSVHGETSLMSGRSHNSAAGPPTSFASRPASARRRTEEDDAAVQRATAALEQAGGAVLRRPFGPARAALPVPASSAADAAPRLGGNTSALPAPTSDRAVPPPQEHRGLRLPSSVPHTTAAATHAHRHRRPRSADGDDAYGADDTDGSASGYSSRSDSRRGRSWADAATRAQPRAVLTAVATPSSSSTAAVPPPAPRVCPGMFAGLSAVPLDERLFACDASHDTADAPARGADAPPRYCVRPLWSLVGTFKTALSGLVTVDLHQACLRWSQRNPKGGQQLIKVPLSAVLDVFTTRVVQEDEQVEERQFTVVVRTSTRPSQVVFGFATTTQANHMRNILKRR